MSYQVIARKYRPQTFDDVVGQHLVTDTLKNAILTDRVAHGYIFSGARGRGKDHHGAHPGQGAQLLCRAHGDARRHVPIVPGNYRGEFRGRAGN